MKRKARNGLKTEEKAKKRSLARTERKQRERYTPGRLRRRRKLSRKEWLVLLIPTLAAVAAVVIVLTTVHHGASYQFAGTGTQYYGGSAAKIEAGDVLRLTESGGTLLEQDNHTSETTLPVYLDDSRKVVLPETMLCYEPRSGVYHQVAALSEIECKANGTIIVTRDGKSAQPTQGFLYDGKDFYLFLESMTVCFNGYTVEVPPLSYIEAVYGGYMMLFNYETKEFMLELCDGAGTAQPESGDYVISLLGDSMTLRSGERILLATRPELFDPLV